MWTNTLHDLQGRHYFKEYKLIFEMLEYIFNFIAKPEWGGDGGCISRTWWIIDETNRFFLCEFVTLIVLVSVAWKTLEMICHPWKSLMASNLRIMKLVPTWVFYTLILIVFIYGIKAEDSLNHLLSGLCLWSLRFVHHPYFIYSNKCDFLD